MFNELNLKKFKGKRILIVGDFILDEYIFGNVERISPEAPVPIVDARDKTVKLGGAANVALNILSLGGIPFLLSVIGNDQNGRKALELMKKLEIKTDGLIVDSKRPTTVKTRIVASSQQLIRIDWENRDYIPDNIEGKILEFINENAGNFDAMLISDYGKGVITGSLFKTTKKLKKNMPIVLDPKRKNYPLYRNVTAVTPNTKETYEATNIYPSSDNNAEIAGKVLIERFKTDYALITRGEKGLSIIGENLKKHIPTRAKQVYDVTGAGDTVASVFTLAIACNLPPVEAAEMANAAAGIEVGKLGATSVTIDEMNEFIRKDNPKNT